MIGAGEGWLGEGVGGERARAGTGSRTCICDASELTPEWWETVSDPWVRLGGAAGAPMASAYVPDGM